MIKYYIHSFNDINNEMNIHFTKCRDNAVKIYFNSNHLPRKQKKKVKKEAVIDYNFYDSLINF